MYLIRFFKGKQKINPFYINVSFLYLLKTIENERFSDVFREYKNETLALSWIRWKASRLRMSTDIAMFKLIVKN